MANRNDKYSEPALPINQFVGLNNKAEPRTMQPGELTLADNIDIDDRARIRRRRDNRKVIDMPGLTSAWATPDEERLFLVIAGTLYEVSGSALGLVTLATGLSDDETHWATDGERVYLSNENGDLVIDRAEAYALAIPIPIPPLISIVSGNLPAGRYLCTMVLEDPRGRQGPACEIVAITALSDGAGLQFYLPDIPAGYTPRYYVSRTNDDQLRAADQVVSDIEELGAVMEEQQYDGQVPPAGGPIAWSDGRLWKGMDSSENGTGLVVGSDAYWPHIFHYGTYDFITPGKVNALADLGRPGLLVGTDRRILVNSLDEGLTELADYGVVPGQSLAIDDDGKVYFWTSRGICRALPFENMTESRVSVPPGDRCAVGIVKHGGFERVVTLTRTRTSQVADNAR